MLCFSQQPRTFEVGLAQWGAASAERDAGGGGLLWRGDVGEAGSSFCGKEMLRKAKGAGFCEEEMRGGAGGGAPCGGGCRRAEGQAGFSEEAVLTGVGKGPGAAETIRHAPAKRPQIQ